MLRKVYGYEDIDGLQRSKSQMLNGVGGMPPLPRPPSIPIAGSAGVVANGRATTPQRHVYTGSDYQVRVHINFGNKIFSLKKSIVQTTNFPLIYIIFRQLLRTNLREFLSIISSLLSVTRQMLLRWCLEYFYLFILLFSPPHILE